MSLIQIDPDDAELKEAIRTASDATLKAQIAQEALDKADPTSNTYIYRQDDEAFARLKRDRALMTLGCLVLERL